MKKRLLIVGRIDSTYIQQLGKHLKEYLDVYLLDITNFKYLKFNDKNEILFEIKLKKSTFLLFLFFQLIKIAKKIFEFIKNEKKFDFVHYHYVKYEYLFLYKLINTLGKKVFVTVWGSDFFHNKFKYLFVNFYKNIDNISFTKNSLLNDFKNYFKIYINYNLVRMGLEQLEYIDNITNSDLNNFKELINYQENEIVILVGSSAQQLENQWVVLEFIKNKLDILNNYNIHFILPLSYGGKINKKILELKQDLTKYFNCTIIDNFLSYKELACLRIISDIYINNRNNDQFAAAMIEHFYAGSVVMHGSWLDYPLNEMGVHYYKYSNENEFIEKLSYILKNIEQEKKLNIANKNIFNNLYKWDNIIHKWIELYKD